ncbi:MAG: hypothetical protein ACREK5_07490 [Gemmatimonadota bacterium]
MRKAWWILAVALVVAGVPGAARAQEEQEEEPPVVRISFFMCDLGDGAGEAIEQEFETRDIPVWNELVAEGMVQEWGTFFHWWADEWNVGIYTIAESIQAIVDASDEAGNRLEERFGEEPTRLDQACPHHRDGFYTAGPSTGMGVEGAAGN